MSTPIRRQSRLQSIPQNTFLGRRGIGTGKGDVQILSMLDAANALSQTGLVGTPGPGTGAAISDGFIISNISGVTQSPTGNSIVSTLAHVFGTATAGAVLRVVGGAWAAGLLTVLGTVTSGIWQGTKIALGFGGTGADLSATGGAHQVLQQTSAGGNVTVGQLAFSDISGRATSAQVPTDVAYLDVIQTWTAAQTIPGLTVTGSFTATGLVTNADLANSSMTLAGHVVSLGGTQAFAAADLSNGTTGSGAIVLANTPALITPNIGAATGASLIVSGQLSSTVATGTAPLSVSSTTKVTNLNADQVDGASVGTSGGTIPLLNAANTWSGVQSINSGDLALKGATSGTITLNAAAIAGTNTITLPAGTTDFSATSGVVQQASAGAAFTVGTVANGQLANSSITLGSTAISLGSTASSVTGLTLTTGTLSGTTTIPGSGAIDTNGNILLGFGSVLTIGGGTAQQYQQVSTNSASFVIATFQAGGNGSGLSFAKSRGSTSTAGADVSGDAIGFIQGFGDDGSTNAQIKIKGALIGLDVDGAVSTGIVPMRIRFNTMNTGGTFAERMRLGSDGSLLLGVTTNAGAGNFQASGNIVAGAIGSKLPDQINDKILPCTATVTYTSNTTFSTITGLSTSTNLTAGKTYMIRGHLAVVSGASGGLKLQTSSAALTFTSSSINVTAFNGTTVVANTTTNLTAMGSIFAQTAIITDVYIEGLVVVNAAGIFNLQAAQNVSNATSTQVLINSYLEIMRANA